MNHGDLDHLDISGRAPRLPYWCTYAYSFHLQLSNTSLFCRRRSASIHFLPFGAVPDIQGAPMEVCNFEGNGDMYGLGIRIGFYLQWYGSILASWIAPEEVSSMRQSNLLFVAATFLATVVQTIQRSARPVDIYLSLLLAFGGYFHLIPLFIWRTLTPPHWDPTRYPRVKMGRIFSSLNFSLLLAVSAFQLWFWIVGVNRLKADLCPQYGFMFCKVKLDQRGFVVASITLHSLSMAICILVSGFTLAKVLGIWEEPKPRAIGTNRTVLLQIVRTIFNTAIASMVIVAAELTIRWNSIGTVSEISSAGQFIPAVIGVEMFVRIIYIAWTRARGSNSATNHSSPAASLTRFPDFAVEAID